MEVAAVDAEGFHEQTPCPDCGSLVTVTYYYQEGFTELECERCGYRSDEAALAELQRAAGDLLEREGADLEPDRYLGADARAPAAEASGGSFEARRLFRSLKA